LLMDFSMRRRWRQCGPLKRWFTQALHGVTSQKMAFLIYLYFKLELVRK
jgi:hypothetical protein